MKKVIYYEDDRNNRPAEDFINSLDFKAKAKDRMFDFQMRYSTGRIKLPKIC